MTEKPRLLNQKMIKAVLEGRKTQTRQPIKVQPDEVDKFGCPLWGEKGFRSYGVYKSPFGKPGDVLWFRETFAYADFAQPEPCYVYKASEPEWKEYEGFKWTPSIHMPREACRLFGLVKKVWVERVQDISEEDALKEGVFSEHKFPGIINGEFHFTSDCVHCKTWMGGTRSGKGAFDPCPGNAKNTFAELWNSIYGNWDKNPWGWCCEFEPMSKEQWKLQDRKGE